MNIQEVRSRIIALPSSGIVNLKDTRFDMGFIDSLANQSRASAIRLRVKQNNPIHNSWYMSYEPEYSKEAQDLNGMICIKYKLIPYISISSRLDGMNFIGSANKNVQYRLVNDRGTFANNQNDSLLAAKQRAGLVHVLIDGQTIEAYSCDFVGTMRLNLIPENPFDVPTWNPEVDPYPIDIGLMEDMIRLLMQTDLIVLTKSFYDRITNGRDETAAPIPQNAT